MKYNKPQFDPERYIFIGKNAQFKADYVALAELKIQSYPVTFYRVVDQNGKIWGEGFSSEKDATLAKVDYEREFIIHEQKKVEIDEENKERRRRIIKDIVHGIRKG